MWIMSNHPPIEIELKYQHKKPLTEEQHEQARAIICKLRDYFLYGMPDISSLIAFAEKQ